MQKSASGVRFVTDDKQLSSRQFLSLAKRTWPGTYDTKRVSDALQQTINITAWDGDTLIGSVRILSDGYFFGTIPEILVDPDYQGHGIGKKLMELAWEATPTSLFFGAQPGKEKFYEDLGYKPSMASYARRKERE